MSEQLKEEKMKQKQTDTDNKRLTNECTYEVMQEGATRGSEQQPGDLLGDIFLFYTLQMKVDKYFTEVH